MNPDRRHELGMMGEEVAATYLAKRGIRVVERRFRRRGGEIDLVCHDEGASDNDSSGPQIVFVEVKTRSSFAFGRPEAGLSASKRRRIVRTAETYLSENGLADRYARIDVVSVVFEDGAVKAIRHFVNAIGCIDSDTRTVWNERFP